MAPVGIKDNLVEMMSQGVIPNEVTYGEKLFEDYTEDAVLELVYDVLEEM